MDKVKINVCNPQALRTLPGLEGKQVEAILRFRAEHGPIEGPSQLASILGTPGLNPRLDATVDYAPTEDTAPEAPGA